MSEEKEKELKEKGECSLERRKYIKRFPLVLISSLFPILRASESSACYTNCFCHCNCYCNCYSDCYNNCHCNCCYSDSWH